MEFVSDPLLALSTNHCVWKGWGVWCGFNPSSPPLGVIVVTVLRGGKRLTVAAWPRPCHPCLSFPKRWGFTFCFGFWRQACGQSWRDFSASPTLLTHICHLTAPPWFSVPSLSLWKKKTESDHLCLKHFKHLPCAKDEVWIPTSLLT